MVLTSLVGAVFNGQLTGLVGCVLLCCIMLVLYLELRPLRYGQGNLYKALMYVGLATKYMEGIVLATSAKDSPDQWPTKTALVVVSAPAIIYIADALQVPELLRSYANRCKRLCWCCCCGRSTPPTRGSGTAAIFDVGCHAFQELCTKRTQEHGATFQALETRTSRVRQFVALHNDMIKQICFAVEEYFRRERTPSITKSAASLEQRTTATRQLLQLADSCVQAAAASCAESVTSLHGGPSWNALVTTENCAVEFSTFCAKFEGRPKNGAIHCRPTRYGLFSLGNGQARKLWEHRPVAFVAKQLMPTAPTLVQTSTLTRILTGLVRPREEDGTLNEWTITRCVSLTMTLECISSTLQNHDVAQ